jgi:hypothetical protein
VLCKLRLRSTRLFYMLSAAGAEGSSQEVI